MSLAIRLVERGSLPDPLVRLGIRRLLRQRLREERRRHSPDAARAKHDFVLRASTAPVAPVPEKANEQHYELPPAFFERVLGRHLKYSGCWWPEGVASLDEAEERSLGLVCERARLADGMEVLELGCGWGSLSLWMAERYPRSRILAVSNSAPQRRFVEARAAARGLTNLEVRTRDMNVFDTEQRFDRIVSVEMFEHMRNWPLLLERVRGWLAPEGLLFAHVFAHKEYAYTFEVEGPSDWMGQHFFTGGIMPSHDLFELATGALEGVERWWMDGTHYARTAAAWLERQDAAEEELRPLFAEVYGNRASLWFQRWRVFFLSCAELFGFRGGSEWGVSHHLLRPAPRARRGA